MPSANLLDPSLNIFPEHPRHIHIMGICGTGMASLAGMLKSRGYHVSGSDQNVYPPMSDFLEESAIAVQSGYSPDNLHPRPDLVVVGNVITRKNPEAIELAALGIPYVSFPQALRHYFLNGKTSLVVAGTHGKTTTSSLLATALYEVGLYPGFMIGGLVQKFGRNFNISEGDYFVVEGDEYDTAFFDKGPKFLHYQPHIAIITSIEFDHADIYADLEAVKNSFRSLVGIMPQDGSLIACFDDPVVREVVSEAQCQVLGYGLRSDLDWSLSELSVSPNGTDFTVSRKGEAYGKFHSVLPGRHNALNALAVIAVMHELGVELQQIDRGISSFQGVKRRQEVRGEVGGIIVIDDFAHHPTAVRETVEALGVAYESRRLVIVFEPRTNTSRRKVFQDAYVEVFDPADEVIIKEAEPLKNVPAEELFSCPKLVDELNGRGQKALYFPVTDQIIEHIAATARQGDVVAILSNGGFDNIHSRLIERLNLNIS